MEVEAGVISSSLRRRYWFVNHILDSALTLADGKRPDDAIYDSADPTATREELCIVAIWSSPCD
jgi:hypothetical protein